MKKLKVGDLITYNHLMGDYMASDISINLGIITKICIDEYYLVKKHTVLWIKNQYPEAIGKIVNGYKKDHLKRIED